MLGILLILAAGTAIGFVVAARYAARPQQIRHCISGLQKLETEIGYSYTPLPVALELATQHLPRPLVTMFAKVRALLGQAGEQLTFHECWQAALEEYWPYTAMQLPEKNALLRLGHLLGKSDREDQLKHLMLAVQELQLEEEHAKQDQVRFERLSRSMGVLVSALVIILII